MIEEVKMVFQGNEYLIILIASLIIGAAFFKNLRKSFFIPGVIISVVILNPVTFDYWYKFSEYGYWRLLWILPVIAASAMVPAFIIEKIQNNWIRVAIIFIAITIFITCGFFVFNHNNTTFTTATNPDKLPDDVIKVGEYLLSIDEQPYVVTDASISQYLRQYSGKIKALYSRDIVFGSPNSSAAMIVHADLSSPEGNLFEVAQIMLNHDYKYLATRNEGKEESLSEAGFVLLKQINSYGVYKVTGERTETRTYNEWHQIETITTIDKEGKLVKNEQGYSIVQHIYNNDGIEMLRYYYDEENNPIQMGSGYFHEYLTKLKEQIDQQKNTVIISVRDEASEDMSDMIAEDLMSLGIRTDLRKKYQYSYYAIVSSSRVVEEVSDQPLEYDGMINDQSIHITSAGYCVGDFSSIIYNGEEYSKNKIGLNIVVIDNENYQVIDSFAINTHRNPMYVTR